MRTRPSLSVVNSGMAEFPLCELDGCRGGLNSAGGALGQLRGNPYMRCPWHRVFGLSWVTAEQLAYVLEGLRQIGEKYRVATVVEDVEFSAFLSHVAAAHP